MPEYADLVYTGRWFAPLREAYDAFFREATRNVTGEVTVKLYKGSATVIARSSPYSLYSMDLVTFEEGAVAYDHHDAEGFIRLNGLRLRTYAARRKALERRK
jgi:argininosuccinate synthase